MKKSASSTRLPVLIVMIVIILLVGLPGSVVLLEANFGTGARSTAGEPAGKPKELAFVSNSADGSISVLDLKARKLVKTINIVPDGKRVGLLRNPEQYFAQPVAEAQGGLNYVQDTDLSRDGTVLFVSRGWLGDVVAVDLATDEILWRTAIPGIRAGYMSVSPDGHQLFVSATMMGEDIVQVLTTENGGKVGQLRAGPRPQVSVVSSDNASVYVGSVGDMRKPAGLRNKSGRSYRISVFDNLEFRLDRELLFTSGIRPFQVSEKHQRIFLQLSNSHDLYEADLASGAIVNQISMPVASAVAYTDWDQEAPHHGLALSPDESTLCVAGTASDYAGIVQTSPLSLAARVPVGNAPGWAAISADGRICLLANTRSDNVSMVSMTDQKEIVRIKVGSAPRHITIGPVGREIFLRMSHEG